MRLKFGLVLLVSVLFLSLSAFAQSGTVFGGYSYANIDTNGATSRLNFNGWQAGTSVNLYKQFSAEANVAGYYNGDVDGYGTSGSNYMYLFGPRVNLGSMLFAHVLFGGDRMSVSGASDSSFAMALGGGAQIKVARHWAVSPSIDYVPTFFASTTQHNLRIGGGIVYLFGEGSSR